VQKAVKYCVYAKVPPEKRSTKSNLTKHGLAFAGDFTGEGVPKRVEIKVLTLKNSWDSNSIWSRFFSVAIQKISQHGKICKVKVSSPGKVFYCRINISRKFWFNISVFI